MTNGTNRLVTLRAELRDLETLRQTVGLSASQTVRLHVLRTMVGGAAGHGAIL